MAINPFRKGGNDTIPVSEGGTGAVDAASARTNLGAGVGDLTTAAHASIDHTGIPGVASSGIDILRRTAPGTSISSGGPAIVTVYTLPANTLIANGEELIFRFVLRASASGSEGVYMMFGGTTIQSGIDYGSTNSFWEAYYRFQRTSASTAYYYAYDFGVDLATPSTTRTPGVSMHFIPGTTSFPITWASANDFMIGNSNAAPIIVAHMEVSVRRLVP